MSDELAPMRERLATRVLAAHRITSERVVAALHAVPRHLFLPDQRPEAAYRDDAIVTKRDDAGQPISSSSQPGIMAIMLDQLDLVPGAHPTSRRAVHHPRRIRGAFPGHATSKALPTDKTISREATRSPALTTLNSRTEALAFKA